MLRPRLRIPQAGGLFRRNTPFIRTLHEVPRLDQFERDQSVPGLLSPAGYATAWKDYMSHIMEKLNKMTAGTDWDKQTPLTILKSAARDPAQAAIFNYASMAHNNHLFFSRLLNLQTLYEQKAQEQASTAGDGEHLLPSEQRIPPVLRKEFEKNFSSIETLRKEFLTTAVSMFGPGFVWLVRNANSQDLRIVVTYLAGSPYTAAHWRRQGTDFNTHSGDRDTVSAFFERTRTGAGHGGGLFAAQAPGGVDVIPLLCLNTWEHVWLTDYGITGKGNYVAAWWEAIDWDKVEAIAAIERRNDFV